MKPKLHLKQFVIDSVSGQRICNCGCGHVVEENMVDRSHLDKDPRNSPEKHMSRPHNKITSHDQNLTTEIGSSVYGKMRTKAAEKDRIFTMKKWQQRIRENDPIERRLSAILQKLADFVTFMQFPRSLQEDASYLARKWVELEESNGRLIGEVAATLLLIASQRSAMPRATESFLCLIEPKRQKYFLRMIREIKLALSIDSTQNKCIPTGIIYKTCEKLDYPKRLLERALAFLEIWKEDPSITGKTPKVVAAVSLCYFIYKDRNGKKVHEETHGRTRIHRDIYYTSEIAETIGVSQVSIRNTLNSIQNFIEKNQEAIDRL